MAQRGSVIVAVMTYQRPDLLRACLESLQTQTLDAFTLCVVDNDPAESARPVVEASANLFGGRVAYLCEPEPGIPAARNTAMRYCANVGGDWVAFLDDDEVADPEWLDALLASAHRWGADGVQGPVVPVFEEGGPSCIEELGFHAKPVADSGSELVHATTANLLLNAPKVLAIAGPEPFDRSLTDYGGSDSELTMRLTYAGAKIVAEPTAIVREFIPLRRQSLDWMTVRAARTTAGWVSFQRHHVSAFRFWLQRVRAIYRWVIRAVFYWGRSRLRHSELDRIRAHLCAARVRGQVLGVRGKFLPEYARATKGTP